MACNEQAVVKEGKKNTFVTIQILYTLFYEDRLILLYVNITN